MSKAFTGVKVVEVSEKELEKFYKDGTLNTDHLPMDTYYPNECIVLKANNKQSGLGIIKNEEVVKIDDNLTIFGVKAKNKEQRFVLNMLNDDDIKLKIITGIEGVGKNYLTAAVVLHKLLEQKKYKKLILTKTTDEVGKSMGLFPGSSSEKFDNYLTSFKYTFANLMGKDTKYFSSMMEKGQIEYIPIQLMRGISFPSDTIIWADEIAGLSPFELRMLGTRLENDSCLILTGSFQQIDRKIKKEETGLWKLINNQNILNSKLTANIELIKNERSELSRLISEAL